MKVHLLIVDDDPDIRDAVARHFRLGGYEVQTAANGREALDKMENARCDIVISDIVMPEMEGPDLLRAIREQYPMVHVIMMTGQVALENVLVCMRRGADTCIFKPFADFEELDAAVRRAVEATQRWLGIMRKLSGKSLEETRDMI